MKQTLLTRAIMIATQAHHGQYDRGGNPYILHPFSVMHLLGKDVDEELKCIAILHDVIEDSDYSITHLRENGFTERIVSAVECLTKVEGQTYEEYMSAVLSNVDSIKVKIADIEHNTDFKRLKGITEKDIARMSKYMTFYYILKEALK